MFDLALPVSIVLGSAVLAVLLVLLIAAMRRRREVLPTAPTIEDLTALGYERGVAIAALRHLEAEKAAGRMRYYTYLGRDGSWGWYVTRETVPATAKPSEYRLELGDWVAGWIVGRDAAIAASQRGGGAA